MAATLTFNFGKRKEEKEPDVSQTEVQTKTVQNIPTGSFTPSAGEFLSSQALTFDPQKARKEVVESGKGIGRAVQTVILQVPKALFTGIRMIGEGALFPETPLTNTRFQQLVHQPVAENAKAVIELLDERQKEIAQRVVDADPTSDFDAQQLAFTITGGAVSFLSGLGILALTKSPTVASLFLTALETSDTYNDAIHAGKTPQQAMKITATEGTITFLLEKFALDSWVKRDMLPNKVVKGITAGIFETGQELLQTFGQNLVRKFGFEPTQKVFQGWVETIISTAPVSIIAGMFLPGFGFNVNTKLIREIQMQTGVSEEEAGQIAMELVDQTNAAATTIEDELKNIGLRGLQIEAVEEPSEEGGVVMNSLLESIEKNTTGQFSKESRSFVRLNEDLAKIIGDDQIYVSEFIVAKVKGRVQGQQGHPEITNEMFLKIPDVLNNPLKIFEDSRTPEKKKFIFIEISPSVQVVVELRRGETGKTEINTIIPLGERTKKQLEDNFKTVFDRTGEALTFPSSLSQQELSGVGVDEDIITKQEEKVKGIEGEFVVEDISARDIRGIKDFLNLAEQQSEVLPDVSRKDITNLKIRIDAIESFLKDDPSRKLMKYLNKDDKLPEILGRDIDKKTGMMKEKEVPKVVRKEVIIDGQKVFTEKRKSIRDRFKIQGDDIINELGYESDVQAQEAVDRRIALINELKGYKKLKSDLKRQVVGKERFIADRIKTMLRIAGRGENIPLRQVIDRQIRPRAPEVTITGREDVLLHKKLKAEAQAAKRGAKAGAIKERARILDILRIQQKNIAQVKKDIVTYAKENLPPAQRGKLLSMVQKAQTQIDLIKAFSRIDAIMVEVRKKELITDLKKKISRFSEMQTVAVDYRQRISAIADTLNFTKNTKDTIQQITKTKEFIQEQKTLGHDVSMPERVMESLAILNRAPAIDMSLAQLIELNERIDGIVQLGKTKQRSKEALYKIEKERIMKELQEEIVPIESHELFQRKIGEKLSFQQKLANAFISLRNFAQHIDLSISPMDVFFDLLDGGDGSYQGAAYRNFKARFDEKYRDYLGMKDEMNEKIWKKVEMLGLEQGNFERIGIHAARVQKNGREKLLNTNLTEADIDSVVLTDKEIEFYVFMRQELDALRMPIAEVMKDIYNRDLGTVEDYFPFMTDWKAMDDVEVFQRIGENVEEIGQPTKTTEQGFTKQRTHVGKQKIRIDALEVFLNHIDNVAYLLHTARDIKMLGEIANSPDFKEAAGDQGTRTTIEWIDVLARKGGAGNNTRIAVLDMLRRNFGAATLGFKLSSAIIQPTALMDGASSIGTWAFKGAAEILTSQDTRQFVIDNMPEIRNRIADDPAFLQLSELKTIADIQKKGFAVLKFLDAITASSVAYGAYLQKLNDLGIAFDVKNPNAEALTYAQQVVRRTQASSSFKDAPLAISRGKLFGNRSFDRALFQFQNFILNRWSIIRHDLWRAGIKHKDPEKAFTIVFWLAMAFLAEEGLRRASKELIGIITGKDEKEKDEYVESVAKNVLGTIPFISQGMSIAAYGGDPIPSFSALEGLRGIRDLDVTTKDIIDLASVPASIFGIPGTRQVSQILRDILSEKEQEPIVGGLRFNFGGTRTRNNIRPLKFNF